MCIVSYSSVMSTCRYCQKRRPHACHANAATSLILPASISYHPTMSTCWTWNYTRTSHTTTWFWLWSCPRGCCTSVYVCGRILRTETIARMWVFIYSMVLQCIALHVCAISAEIILCLCESIQNDRIVFYCVVVCLRL